MMQHDDALAAVILDVLGAAGRLLTRCELFRDARVTAIQRNEAAIRAAVAKLLKSGHIAEPRGRGQGLEITGDGSSSRRAA